MRHRLSKLVLAAAVISSVFALTPAHAATGILYFATEDFDTAVVLHAEVNGSGLAGTGTFDFEDKVAGTGESVTLTCAKVTEQGNVVSVKAFGTAGYADGSVPSEENDSLGYHVYAINMTYNKTTRAATFGYQSLGSPATQFECPNVAVAMQTSTSALFIWELLGV